MYETVDSTNLEARRLIAGGKRDFAVFSKAQVSGRGRNIGGRIRTWESEPGQALTMSISASVSDPPQSKMLTLPLYIGLCVLKAVKTRFGVDTSLKWPNDVYLHGKKVSGILVETFVSDNLTHVIAGIGVNINNKSFSVPDAVSIFMETGVRHDVLEFARCILDVTDIRSFFYGGADFLDEYKRYSCTIGQDITYTKDGISKNAAAVDIDGEGSLIVTSGDGDLETLISGEVMLKKK